MARGRLEPPDLDDRTWQDIVDQARALIPHYAPDWTDTSPSDLGMTLVELFAWIVEGMIYRLNRVPDRNYIEFLNLIGITRDPASPATLMLRFEAAPGTTAPVTVGAGTQVATASTETQQAVVFETDADLAVLPPNLVDAYLLIPPDVVAPDDRLWDATGLLVAAPLKGAAISLKAGRAAVLYLGFDQPLTPAQSAQFVLDLRVTEGEGFSRGASADQGTIGLRFSYTSLSSDGKKVNWTDLRADQVRDETNALSVSGRIVLNTPKDWAVQPRGDWMTADPNGPVLVVPTSLQSTSGQKLAFTASAVSSNDGQMLTFSLEGPPLGATIDATSGQFTWTPAATGTFAVVVKVTESPSTLVAKLTTTIVVVPAVADAPPLLSVPASVFVNAGQALAFTARALPTAAGQTLAYTLDAPPAGASINSAAGTFTWTPTAAGTTPIVVTVTESPSTKVSKAIVVVSVLPSPHDPLATPFLMLPTPLQVALGQPLAFKAQALPTTTGQTLTFALESPPAGASLTSAGAFSWTPTAAGSFSFVVKVTESPSTKSARAVAVAVVVPPIPDPIPVIAVPNFLQTTVGQAFAFTAVGIPTTAGQTLTFALDAPPVGASITSAGGFSWTPTVAGAFPVAVKVTESSGKAARAIATLTVIPTPPDPFPPRARLRLRIAFDHPDPQRQARVRLDHLLFNSVRATNALTTKPADSNSTAAVETFSSDETPFQRFDLRFRPLYKTPATPKPYDHLTVKVRLATGADEDWPVVEEFPATADPAVRVQPVTGTIEFGDGVRGKIPPKGTDNIRVLTYRYVAGGADGNVAPGVVAQIRDPLNLTGRVKVTNPGAAKGGAAEEDIEETKRRGPESLRSRSRAVTVDDYEYLARETSTAVAKVRCLPALPPSSPGSSVFFGGLDRNEGHVNVLIVPDVRDDPRPRPSTELIREIQDALGRLHVVTSSLTVTGPRYLPIKVNLVVRLFLKQTAARTRTKEAIDAQVRAAVEQYLHPIAGGPLRPGQDRGDGWEIGQHLFVPGLFERVQGVVAGEGFIESLTLEADTPDYLSVLGTPTTSPAIPPQRPNDNDTTNNLGRIKLAATAGASAVGVALADYELVCSAGRAIHDLTIFVKEIGES